jgi:hypothetical protein
MVPAHRKKLACVSAVAMHSVLPRWVKLRSGDAVAESPFDPAQRTLTGCQRSLPDEAGSLRSNQTHN